MSGERSVVADANDALQAKCGVDEADAGIRRQRSDWRLVNGRVFAAPQLQRPIRANGQALTGAARYDFDEVRRLWSISALIVRVVTPGHRASGVGERDIR